MCTGNDMVRTVRTESILIRSSELKCLSIVVVNSCITVIYHRFSCRDNNYSILVYTKYCSCNKQLFVFGLKNVYKEKNMFVGSISILLNCLRFRLHWARVLEWNILIAADIAQQLGSRRETVNYVSDTRCGEIILVFCHLGKSHYN